MANVRDATIFDVDDVVNVHLFAINRSINSAIGSQRLKYLYEQVLNSSSGVLLVAIEDGQLVGFICGTSSYHDFVRESRGAISARDVVRVFQKLGVLTIMSEVNKSLRLHLCLRRLGDIFYLALWGMRPGSNPALGAELFRNLAERSKDVGSKKLIASVENDNLRVRKMYKMLGFVEIKNCSGVSLLERNSD